MHYKSIFGVQGSAAVEREVVMVCVIWTGRAEGLRRRVCGDGSAAACCRAVSGRWRTTRSERRGSCLVDGVSAVSGRRVVASGS